MTKEEELDLRKKLDKEISEGFYSIEGGGMVVTTGKQGKINYEVEIRKGLENPGIRKQMKQADTKYYNTLTVEKLETILLDLY